MSADLGAGGDCESRTTAHHGTTIHKEARHKRWDSRRNERAVSGSKSTARIVRIPFGIFLLGPAERVANGIVRRAMSWTMIRVENARVTPRVFLPSSEQRGRGKRMPLRRPTPTGANTSIDPGSTALPRVHENRLKGIKWTCPQHVQNRRLASDPNQGVSSLPAAVRPWPMNSPKTVGSTPPPGLPGGCSVSLRSCIRAFCPHTQRGEMMSTEIPNFSEHILQPL